MSYAITSSIDWLSFTSRDYSPEYFIDYFGHSFGSFMQGSGRYAYRNMYSAPGLNIYSQPVFDSMGTLVEISGSGCQHLYNQGFDFQDYLGNFLNADEDINITRLDLCLDYFADSKEDHFNFNALLEAVESLSFVSQVHKNPRSVHIDLTPSAFTTNGDLIGTVYLGSKSSHIRLRVYNKLGEYSSKDISEDKLPRPDGLENITQWIRFEFQLRYNNAVSAAVLLADYECQSVFNSLLDRYIRFVDTVDSCSSRSINSSWWDDFLNKIHKTVISRSSVIYPVVTPLTVYNYVNKLKNCLYTYVQLYGVSSLLDIASSPMDVFPLKYSMLILQYKRCLNDGWEDII